jgi:hypothetical protein
MTPDDRAAIDAINPVLVRMVEPTDATFRVFSEPDRVWIVPNGYGLPFLSIWLNADGTNSVYARGGPKVMRHDVPVVAVPAIVNDWLKEVQA